MENQGLLNNEDIFKTVVQEAPMPTALYQSRDIVVQFANAAMKKIWGTGEDVTGKKLSDLIPELAGQSFLAILDDVYTTGNPYRAEEQPVQLMADGELQTFYFNITYKPLFDADGNVYAIFSMSVDITQQVRSRMELKAIQQKTHFALDSAGMGTWTIYPLQRIVEWDDRCKELCGFQKSDEITLDTLLKYLHPDDLDRINAAAAFALNQASGGNYDVELRVQIGPEKQVRWLRCKGKAYFNVDGQPYQFAGTTVDITESIELKEAKEKKDAALRAVEKRFEVAFDNASVGVLILGIDGCTIIANKVFSAMLGYTQAEMIGKSFTEFSHPDAIPASVKFITQAINGEINSFVLEKKFIKSDGTIAWGRLSGALLRTDNGTPDSFINIVQDITQERKDHEEQRKLLFLVDNSSDFVSLSDLDGNVTYVNKAGQQMVGLGNPDDVRRHNSEYLMPGEVDRLRNVINKGLFENGAWTGDVNYRHFKTHEPIPINGTSMLVYDSLNGNPLGRATVARDLRPEIAAQKALKESEQLLKNITSAAPTALWMSDQNGNITYVNQTWIDWTGYPYHEHMGTGWAKAIVDEDKEQAGIQFLADLSQRRYYESHFRIHHQDGSVRSCIATGNPQYQEDGSFSGYIGACTDITEKTLAEQRLVQVNAELRNQIKQFEFVTGFMPVQLWTAKVDGALDYVNARAEEYFGIPAADIIGDAWQTMIHPEDLPRCIAIWVKSLESGNPYQVEFRIKNKEDVYRWHLARALPFNNEQGFVKWFGTNTDIDEQKQLQKQKDEFIGIASHELKTPVTSIKAYAQVLEAMFLKKGDLREAGMVNKMNAQVNRLTNLIGDLLDVTKLHTGKLQFNESAFDFNEMVHEVVEEVQRITERHTITEDYVQTGIVHADKDRIGQVITNLITNAIKYSPDASKVIVFTRIKDGEVRLCVQDFGIGIARDKKDRVFEQFYRVSGDKQHTFPGLGLGLYISSEIIKREGGKIWVESVEGKGSTFCFSIPVK